jgi:crotonobetainyl-CoA:carnitine CoA-transferase CaiB-like acyl-CoA transferase
MAYRSPMSLPLRGIKIVEFSHMVMGPTCGMILADLGADVIKVEPLQGDNTRRLKGSGAAFFPAFNRNKRSISIDLKSAEGVEIVLRLIEQADAVIENFRPGALDKLGFGYADLSKRNPRLIYCSLKGFLSGPYEHRVALDEVVQFMGGLAYMTGPTGRPLRAGSSVNDIMGGMFATIAILAAIQERAQTDKGQHLRSALFENNVFLVAQHMVQEIVTGKPAAPLPERLAAWAVYDLFDTSDGQRIFVGVVTDTQWVGFCKHFGLTEFLDDPNLARNPDRVVRREQFMPALKELFRGMSLAEALASCDKLGLPYAPIATPSDLFTDPHLNQSGGLLDITLNDGRAAVVPALPVDFDGLRLGVRRDIPTVGQHNEEVLHELQYSDDEVKSLYERQIVGSAPFK